MILAPKTRAGINNTIKFNTAALIILPAIGPCSEHPPPPPLLLFPGGCVEGGVGVAVGCPVGTGVGVAVGPGVGVGFAARTD